MEQSLQYHFKLADPEMYFLGRKKISSFSELSKLTGIIDSVYFNDQVIVLFQNGFYSFYSVDHDTGDIKLEAVKLLNNNSENIDEKSFGNQVFRKVIEYGDFLQSDSYENYLLFFG